MPDLFQLGMTSDAALYAIRKNRLATLRPALRMGKNQFGMVVVWFVKGYTLRFERQAPAPSPYKLIKIDKAPDPVTAPKVEEKPKKRTKRGPRGRKPDGP